MKSEMVDCATCQKQIRWWQPSRPTHSGLVHRDCCTPPPVDRPAMNAPQAETWPRHSATAEQVVADALADTIYSDMFGDERVAAVKAVCTALRAADLLRP